MKSILFVSIAFPPKFDAEGLQVAKYLKYLLREGGGHFDIDVVTSRMPTLNMSYDPSLESASIGIRQRIELPIFENKYSNFILALLEDGGEMITLTFLVWYCFFLVVRPDGHSRYLHQIFQNTK